MRLRKPYALLLALTVAFGAHGEFSREDLQRIDELKRNPERIAQAIADAPQSNVARFFKAAVREPARFRHYLGRAEEPEAFRHHLLGELSLILRTGRLPDPTAKFEDYLFALFAAFREPNPQSKVRYRAYRLWAHDILPVIGAETRASALASLRQRCRQADQRVDAIPALLLAERGDRVATLLNEQVRGDDNPEVRSRAMEALHLAVGRSSPTGRDSNVQVASVAMLRDTDPRVRAHAAAFLADLSEMKGRTRRLLQPETHQALVTIVADDAVAAPSRLAAMRVLGGDLFVDFFDTQPKFQYQPVYAALAGQLDATDVDVRRCAAKTLALLKPLDATTMTKLVDAAFGSDGITSGHAFTALGAHVARDAERRFQALPARGAQEVTSHLLSRLEQALAVPRQDPDGSRRRAGAELVRINVPTDGESLARLSTMILEFPAQEDAVDRHVRATLLSALVVPFPDTIAFEGIADPHSALERLVRAVVALPEQDRRTLEPVVLGLRPTEEALLAALDSTEGAVRRLLVLQIASYSDGRLQQLTQAAGADEVLARCFDDRTLARLLLDAFARKRDRITFRHTPRLLARVLDAAAAPDDDAPADVAPMHENAARILTKMATTRGRHLAFGDDEGHRPLRQQLLQLAVNEEAPEASRVAAQSLRSQLERRRGGPGRCAADLAAMAPRQDPELPPDEV